MYLCMYTFTLDNVKPQSVTSGVPKFSYWETLEILVAWFGMAYIYPYVIAHNDENDDDDDVDDDNVVEWELKLTILV